MFPLIHRWPAGNRALRRFVHNEHGATMTEYAFMVALIAVAIVAVVVALGVATEGLFRADDDALKNALDESTS